MRIHRVAAGPRLAEIARLFREYQRWLGIDLCFQDFEAEVAALPGCYAPPRGEILLAEVDGAAAGCVAFRPLGRGACEMKRLFVRSSFRGLGVGRKLAARVMRDAARAGYRAMKLDTVPKLEAAIGLYRSLGFRETKPYCHNPLEGAMFFRASLNS